MCIAIRKEPKGSLYMDKEIYSRTQEVQDEQGNITIQPLFTDETLAQPPYNYTKVDIDDKYSDCQTSDFNDDLTFNVEKYNARKQKQDNENRIAQIKPRLEQLSQDLIQAQVGAVFEDLEERKAEFQVLHNELRVLLGKEPREYVGQCKQEAKNAINQEQIEESVSEEREDGNESGQEQTTSVSDCLLSKEEIGMIINDESL